MSEMVQSVDEVGGHEYMCQCDSSTAVDCRLFKIGGICNNNSPCSNGGGGLVFVVICTYL